MLGFFHTILPYYGKFIFYLPYKFRQCGTVVFFVGKAGVIVIHSIFPIQFRGTDVYPFLIIIYCFLFDSSLYITLSIKQLLFTEYLSFSLILHLAFWLLSCSFKSFL